MRGKITAFIPARGGSKGIPGKNKMILAGKPVIAWTIDVALSSKYIDSVVVSTDDVDIADIARKAGADVPFLRPAEISGDLSLDFEAFDHYLTYLEEIGKGLPDLLVHLRASSPVRDIEIIDGAIEMMLNDKKADALRSMNQPVQTPYKMWHIADDGYAMPLLKVNGMEDPQSSPRQQLPVVYWQNGYVDVVRPSAIKKYQTMWGKKLIPYLVDKPLFELDYPENIPDVEKALLAMQKGIFVDENKEKSTRHSV